MVSETYDIQLASAAFDEVKLRNIAGELLNNGVPFDKLTDILIEDYGFSSELLGTIISLCNSSGGFN